MRLMLRYAPMPRRSCLFVTYGLPHPTYSGSRIRYYHLIRQVAQTWDVSLLSLLEYRGEASFADELSFCREVETVMAPPGTGWRGQAGALARSLHGWPWVLRQYHAHELSTRLRRLAAERRPDVVSIEHLELAPYV